MLFGADDILNTYTGVPKITRSDCLNLSATRSRSSFWTHTPGVLNMQVMQPLQGKRSSFRAYTVSVSAPAVLDPSRKGAIILSVLLRLARGLQLKASIFTLPSSFTRVRLSHQHPVYRISIYRRQAWLVINLHSQNTPGAVMILTLFKLLSSPGKRSPSPYRPTPWLLAETGPFQGCPETNHGVV